MSHTIEPPVVWTATIDDLHKVEGKAELVDGRLLELGLTGGFHALVSLEIAVSLHAHARRMGAGHAIGDGAGFIVDLPHRRSFAPDAAFYVGPLSEGFVPGAPALAVEIRSPEDFGPAAEQRLARKRTDYFAAGTLVVWDVDPLRDRVVRAYRASTPDAPDVFKEEQEADAEPAVPGWRVRVAAIMPPAHAG